MITAIRCAGGGGDVSDLAQAATLRPPDTSRMEKKMLRLVFADFVNRHDVRMIEARRRGGFVAKALHRLGRGKFAGKNHFNRHLAMETDLACAIDHSHPTARNFLEQLVIAKAAHLERAEQIIRRRRFLQQAKTAGQT
jgi:hypothetical protein